MIRVGDKVYATYQMSVKGIVKEIFYTHVTAGLAGGPLSKRAHVIFDNIADGKEYTIRLEDVRKSDD